MSHNTVQEVRNYLKADRVLIYCLNRDSEGIIAESVGQQWTSLMGQYLHDPCLHEVKFFNSPNPIQNITDIEQETLDPCYVQMLRESEVRGNLVISITQDNEIWGYLIAQQCANSRQWQADEINLLKKLSEQVAIAIQQAELYQQSQIELEQREKLTAQLHYEARHDQLTGLANRSLLMDRLRHTFQVYKRHDIEKHSRFALLFLDLNRFKIINDTLGHEAGDQVLITVAERLQNSLREMDTVGRLGGDEFIVIIEDINGEEDAIEVANRIHQSFAPPAYINSENIYLSTSMGIVMDSPDYSYPEEMLRDADVAMYEAKRNQLKYAIFDPRMQASVTEEWQLEAALREAIKQEQFILHYQPIFHLETGEIRGIEALIRWQHPQKGLMFPDDFIAIAKQAKLMPEIEFWALQKACSQRKDWQTNYPLHISISPHLFYQEGCRQKLQEILETVGEEASFLKLEITEEILLEKRQLALTILEELKSLGIRICLDGFGVGYSSLSSLNQFPIHCVKLDQSLMTNLDHEEHNRQIIKAISHLCHSFKIGAIVTGVETNTQKMTIKECGYELAQGFHFCQPLSAEEMTAFLATKPALS